MDFRDTPYCTECGCESLETLSTGSELVDGVDCQYWEYHCNCCWNVWIEYVPADEMELGS